MKIAQVAPLHESVPPRAYGGTERVVAYLCDALIEAGHDVTLYASADSQTRARLRPMRGRAIRLDETCLDPLAPHLLMVEKVFQDAESYDVIHFHTDYMHFSLARRLPMPQVTTLHGRLDLPELKQMFREFPEMPLVSISDSQRAPLHFANWIGTVHHGLPEDFLPFRQGSGGYLAFLGRFTPEKRAETAIEIAKRAGVPIKLAAKIDRAFEDYFNEKVKPWFSDPDVEYVGELGEHEKGQFLGDARGLLFPIDWPEPFGLVMIEAFACGTPVIACRRGSTPEIVTDGETGFLVDTVERAVAAVGRLDEIRRFRCRLEFEERFSASRMADDYVRIYDRVVESANSPFLVA